MDSSGNPIEAVRERLDGGRKWHKGTLGNPRDPEASLCIVGACYGARVHSEDVMDVIQAVVVEQYPDRIDRRNLAPGRTPAPDFNDHPDTTWADVDLVLDKAARRWDEQVRP